MKKLTVNPLLALIILALSLWSCSSKYPGYDKTKTGLYYKIYHAGKDTVKPKVGNWISYEIRYSVKDSVLFDSKQGFGMPMWEKVLPPQFKGDLVEGLMMMTQGDSASFIVSADSMFKQSERRPRFIDSNSVMTFHIHLLAVETRESLMKKEIEKIADYVAAKKIAQTPSESGSYFIEKVAGKGPKIDSGSWVSVHYTVSLADGKKIFATVDRGEPKTFEFGGAPVETQGFYEGISKMTKGGQATFIVPSRLAFQDAGRPGAGIGPYCPIVYDVEVIDVQSKADHDKKYLKEESDNISKYLKSNKINAKPLPSGLIYIEKEKGKGARAAAGKTVLVHYTGTLLDGTKFDSSRDRNQPFEFTIGKHEVIDAWDEGIAKMNVGGKATLIVPFRLGYGSEAKRVIPAYSTLVFDVELVAVK